MKIGVISDTHIPAAAAALPARIKELFAGVDLILHAGDLVELKVIDELAKIAPVEAVSGNMDPALVTRKLPAKRIVEAGGFRIGLVHGWGPPASLREWVKHVFAGEKVDAIVYGHSHAGVSDMEDGILFFNPGSPTDKAFTQVNTVGILELGEKITGEIIKLK